MRQTPRFRWVLVVSLAVLISTLAGVANASECSACGYLAKNCSASSTSVDVCDATGSIQIDDVFCNDDECQCADGHKCVSTVVGCTNLFQARNRRRCLGNATLSRRFEQCAVSQGLTTLNASNVASDWVHFKQGAKCQSTDCLAVRMFHQSGLVQCGNLLAVWKTNSSSYDASESVTFSSSGGDAVYHFVADGSRGSDMKAGTFLYSVPWSSESVTLITKQANSSAINSCYVLQTRNQPNGTCEGVYLQFDASVQFANSDEYVMSELSWPVWLAVVASVAAAIAAIVIIGVVVYRFQHMDTSPPVEADEDDGLLLDDLRDRKLANHIGPASLRSTSPASGRGVASTDLRQRGSGSTTFSAATSELQMEAGAKTSL
ncbi:hypothetical protein PF005_g12477 [Phytophthora fragariae]|nr:hypothetical protein PF003_g4698 [Phytophthora fragariae]KAE9032653.1 hypothetical protein PR002_g9080 [Phytophthora rubi]KAE8936415.1 hypothetical protein PF009_g13666 [Phytophthora fragariae]KAE9108107.1 hypothetical protein PF010_g12041 [Phytophthora fragariae]KAE9108338.1 hypothetical protein PF007_g12699 [Phytophthora fragariae]